MVCVSQKQRDAELDGMMPLKLDFPQNNAFLLLVCNFFSSSENKNLQCSNLRHVIFVNELHVNERS